MAINIHSGVLSSASNIIKKKYQMNDKTFSYFGLTQGVGRFCGTSFFILTCNTLSIKWIVGVSTLLKAVVCLLFNVPVNNGWYYIGLRGILGITHMPPSTYIPIWIDQYGLRKYKTVQMTGLQALVPVGKVLGYLLQVLFGERWGLGFAVEGFYLIFCGLFISFSPAYYFNKKVVLLKDTERFGEYKEGELREVSIFHVRKSEKKEEGKSQLLSEFCTIIKNKAYLCAAFSKVMVNGSQSCIHFWTADFMRNRLGVKDSKLIFFSYSTMSVVGPFLGMGVTSVINKVFGSYEEPNAPFVLLGVNLITTGFGLAATLVNHFYFFCVSLSIFFGMLSVCLSIIHGLIMVAVGPDLKSLAYSTANLGTNIIGAATFPTIYGAMNDFCYPYGIKFGGMLTIMTISGSTCILMFILGILRRKKLKEDNEKDEELVEIDKDN